EAKDLVRAVRADRGIPSMDDKTEFENWLKSRTVAQRREVTTAPASETKESKLARGVEAKAVQANLTKSFEGLSEYGTVKVADQAERAVKLLTDNPESARRIAMGEEQPPAGLLPESVFTAVENRALKEGDVDTLRDLATSSSRPVEASTMGQ